MFDFFGRNGRPRIKPRMRRVPRVRLTLERLEGRHQQVQSQHEVVRRGLEQVSPREATELRNAWRRYCEVIAELDETTAEIEALRRLAG